jgi:hypothetical protein
MRARQITSSGGGYWIASANGAVNAYRDTPNDGSLAAQHLNGAIVAATAGSSQGLAPSLRWRGLERVGRGTAACALRAGIATIDRIDSWSLPRRSDTET